MKTITKIVFLIMILFQGVRLNAQEKWTLKQCIDYATENNLDIKQTRIQEKITSESLSQSKRDLLPSIGASSSAGLSFGRSVDQSTDLIANTRFFNNSYSASASVNLFDGFNSLNQIEYQKFRKKASELNRLNAIDDLAFSIMYCYFNVLYYEGMLKIAKEQVEASKLNLKKAEKQVELGLKSKTDHLEMSANLEKEELNRIQIENSLKKTVLQLKQLMNLTDKADLILEPEQSAAVATEKPDQENLFLAFTQWSPYYQSQLVRMNQSKTLLAISRSQLYPSISAYGSVGTGYYKNVSGTGDAFKNQFKNNLGESLGASLSIPIFSRWSGMSGVKIAKLNVEESKIRLDQEKQKLYFEMINNLNDLESLEKEYNQNVKRQAAEQLVYEAAVKKLEQGLISVVDFYIAKNTLANTNSQVLQAKLQWEIKKKILDFYEGKRFWE
jgi:outer membrane protein